MADKIEIEIDGKKLEAAPNSMVIQVADEAGIYIPRFCYHKHLSIAANCRMCLVEVEKSGKPLPACATPIMPGMKVFTRSPKALAAQKAVMEFLLINHPLDCPICDQGGECELQDLSMGFGDGKSFYTEGKRSVKDKDIGPLIETEMTRCIQCTRCVRFGTEIAGMRELGATGRGEDMEIGTYIEHAMQSEVSGNVIDICPVGALTSKPYRFTARAWELDQRPTISPHDCVGSNLYAHIRYGKLMRMVPRENIHINETWISDRDRFSYEAVYHADRVTKPLIKKDGKWQEASWQEALELTVHSIQQIIARHGADQFGALAAPSSTTEELYSLQKLMRGLGTSNIDHRLRETDFTDQDHRALYPSLGMKVADIENCDVIFLIGSNIQKEQPSAGLRVRKAFLKGAKIIVLNPYDFTMYFDTAETKVVSIDEMVAAISDSRFVSYFQNAKNACILLGNMAMNHPQAAAIRQQAAMLAKQANAKLGLLTEGANGAGAWLAGAIPHRGAAGQKVKAGLDAQAMLTNNLKAYMLLNVEPDFDCANPVAAGNALQQAEFVVSISQFRNATIDQYANVILPVATFVETSGTFVNAAGEWQSFTGVASAFEEARPAWKVLRVLGNLFHVAGFEYESSEEIRHELKAIIDEVPAFVAPEYTAKYEALSNKHLYRVGPIPLYSTDVLTRRANALQAAQPVLEGEMAKVRVHPTIAKQLQLEEGELVKVKQKDGQIRLPVKIDKRLPERGVLIFGGLDETSGLSELFGAIELQK